MIHLSPKNLLDDFKKWQQDGKKHQYPGISLLFPMLIHKGYNRRSKRYVYHCVHLTFKDGKAKCRIYSIRPYTCRDFPLYGEGKISMSPRDAENPSHYKGCGYNADRSHGREFPVSQFSVVPVERKTNR
jgi:Fe-S-cluster containining protein